MTIESQVDELLGRMTVKEKVGLMFHTAVIINRKGAVDTRLKFGTAGVREMITERHMTHFNLMLTPGPARAARWHNDVQRIAAETRLGIPVTISSDPRHAASVNPGSGILQKGFSQWPSQLGLAALRDESVVERFGAVARAEFMAMGIRTVLNPMADLATEPRWGRVGGTLGEDPELAGRLTAAYIAGFQGGRDGLDENSVSCMVKHFPGCGPVVDGLEPHFSFGANQAYPGDRLEDHVAPFRAAAAAGVRQMMLSYGIPVGQTSEDVAMAFNKEIITDLLREDLGFDGVVCTDWMTHETEKLLGVITMKHASAWGVEGLSVEDRYVKSLDAGVDQFGGQSDPSTVIELVRSGRVSESRIDESAGRLLRTKFELGLFDAPYVDADAAATTAGTDEFVAEGLDAQRRSTVVVTNDGVLPHGDRARIYVKGVDKKTAQKYGEVVSSAGDADIAIVRVAAPSRRKLRREVLTLFFPQGDLTFTDRKLRGLLKTCEAVPTVVDIRIDRPPVIPEVAEKAAAVLATFGVADDVVLDTVFGTATPEGRLPVEFPRSMEAIRASKTDVAGSEDPLFPRGHGLEL